MSVYCIVLARVEDLPFCSVGTDPLSVIRVESVIEESPRAVIYLIGKEGGAVYGRNEGPPVGRILKEGHSQELTSLCVIEALSIDSNRHG